VPRVPVRGHAVGRGVNLINPNSGVVAPRACVRGVCTTRVTWHVSTRIYLHGYTFKFSEERNRSPPPPPPTGILRPSRPAEP